MKLLTTKEVAEKLGITTVRVRQMVLSGQLPAEKFGHVHMIREDDLNLVAERKRGRPSATEAKKKAEKSAKKSKKRGTTK